MLRLKPTVPSNWWWAGTLENVRYGERKRPNAYSITATQNWALH